MSRVLLLALVLGALALPAGALAQSNPFGPLPPAAPTPTPVPTEDPRIVDPDGGDVGRSTLFVIGGGLITLFVAIGYVITRDARQTLPEAARRAERDAPRDEGPHMKPRQAKAKARQKTRAQRKARRTTRRRAK